MKKLIIICEGITEELFGKKILKEHFKYLNIEAEFPLISHSSGGIVKWTHLQSQIENTLAIDPYCFTTTFIDYYGIATHHKFPKWEISLSEIDKSRKMSILENGMLENIPADLQNRFIPYIQLHEFEALVFSEYASFENYYEASEANFVNLKIICNSNPNPETINNSRLTAPSKRLEDNIRRYDKKTHGIDICEMIGLPKIRAKCPRFNEWITKLENI